MGRRFVVEILGDEKDLVRANNAAERSMGRLERQARVAGRGFATLTGGVGKFRVGIGAARSGVTGMAAAAVGLATGGLAVLTGKVLGQAQNLELLDRKAHTVFGSAFPQMERWAGRVATRMGATTRQVIGMSAGLQDLLVPMGFSREKAAAMTRQTIALSGALSEWSGGTRSAAEVTEILQAAFLGERDALQDLGIGISQAQVDAQVLANKKRGLKFATDEQAQAQATLDLILAKSTDAQKAYATGQGTLASKSANLRAKLGEIKDTLVAKLTPALSAATGWLAGRLPGAFAATERWVDRNRDHIRNFGLITAQVFLRAAGYVLIWGGRAVQAGGYVIGMFRQVLNVVLNAFSGILHGAAKAFGWVPGLGGKLRGAEQSFDRFKDTTIHALDVAAEGAGKMGQKLTGMGEASLRAADRVGKVRDRLNEVKSKNVTVSVRDKATGAVRIIQRTVSTLHDKQITVSVRSVFLGSSGRQPGRGVIVAQFSKGGEVTGGIPGQDSVPILAKPGERVLTVEQNAALKRLLGGRGAAAARSGVGGRGGDVILAGPVYVQIDGSRSPQATVEQIEQWFVRLKRLRGGAKLAFES